MTAISILEYDPRFSEGVHDVIERGLTSAGVALDKYPQVWNEIAPEYIVAHYRDRSRFWVATKEDRCVGTIALSDRGHDGIAEIKRMFVHPDFQGAGVAQMLLDTAIAFARSAGYTKLYLETDALMKRAHRFYEKNGFTVGTDYGDWQTYERVL